MRNGTQGCRLSPVAGLIFIAITETESLEAIHRSQHNSKASNVVLRRPISGKVASTLHSIAFQCRQDTHVSVSKMQHTPVSPPIVAAQTYASGQHGLLKSLY